MASTMIKEAVVIFLAFLVSACDAGDFCYRNSYLTYSTYCMYGCCGYSNEDCCSGPVGLIVGLCVGGAVFLFFIILTICLCRRRRYGGFIYRSQPAVVVQQQSTMANQNGVVTTAGVQPGVTYPPYPQYQYYPTAPNSTAGYNAPPNYHQGPQPGYGYPPPQQAAYPTEPPKYDSLNFEANGGLNNRGFDEKN